MKRLNINADEAKKQGKTMALEIVTNLGCNKSTLADISN